MGLNHSEEERGNERVLSIFIVGFFFQAIAFHFRLLVFVKVGLPFMSIWYARPEPWLILCTVAAVRLAF